ncbi:MAG: J domain-containing protein [Bdellovibrionota bacterium]|nr:MAG: J domain-containing protein [Bdellovibrionota bacterium]
MIWRSAQCPGIWKSSLAAACLCAVLCLAHADARADEVLVATVPLPVDKVRTLDNRTSELTVFGQSAVIAKDKVAPAALRRYLAAGRRVPFTADQVRTVLESGIQPEFREVAFLTLESIARTPDPNLDGDIWELVQTLLTDRQTPLAYSKELLVQSWMTQLPRLLLGTLILHVATSEPRWPKENISALIVVARDGVIAELVAHASRAGMRADLEQLKALSALSAEILGVQDDFISIFRRVCSEVGRALEQPGTSSLEALRSLADATVQSPLVQPLIQTALQARSESVAMQALENKDAGSALLALSFIDMDRRTPTIHSLVERSLIELAPSRTSIIGYRPVNLMLRFLATKDDAIRTAYIIALERQLRSMAKEFPVVMTEFDFYLRQVLLLRADPSSENDSLRIAFTARLLNEEKLDEARSIMREVRTGVPFVARLKLFWAEFSKDIWTLLLTALGFIIVGLAIRIRARQKEVKQASQIEAEDQRSKEGAFQGVGLSELEGEESEGGFSLLRQRQMLNPTFLEYERCLTTIGIHSRAALREIKAQYRKRIKDIHPDSVRGSNDARAAEEFMEVTRAYDRALELRRVLGLSDE